MTKIRSAKVAIQMVRSMTGMTMVGARKGSVTLVKRCQGEAPSMAAASCNSEGIDFSAASSVMAKNGMPNQMLATIGPHMAVAGSNNTLVGSAFMPCANSQCGSGPMIGLNSQAQVRPERKDGTAQGRNTTAWTTLRPKKGLSSSSA